MKIIPKPSNNHYHHQNELLPYRSRPNLVENGREAFVHMSLRAKALKPTLNP